MTKEELECKAREYAKKKYADTLLMEIEGDVVQDWCDGYERGYAQAVRDFRQGRAK